MREKSKLPKLSLFFSLKELRTTVMCSPGFQLHDKLIDSIDNHLLKPDFRSCISVRNSLSPIGNIILASRKTFHLQMNARCAEVTCVSFGQKEFLQLKYMGVASFSASCEKRENIFGERTRTCNDSCCSASSGLPFDLQQERLVSGKDALWRDPRLLVVAGGCLSGQ